MTGLPRRFFVSVFFFSGSLACLTLFAQDGVASSPRIEYDSSGLVQNDFSDGSGAERRVPGGDNSSGGTTYSTPGVRTLTSAASGGSGTGGTTGGITEAATNPVDHFSIVGSTPDVPEHQASVCWNDGYWVHGSETGNLYRSKLWCVILETPLHLASSGRITQVLFSGISIVFILIGLASMLFVKLPSGREILGATLRDVTKVGAEKKIDISWLVVLLSQYNRILNDERSLKKKVGLFFGSAFIVLGMAITMIAGATDIDMLREISRFAAAFTYTTPIAMLMLMAAYLMTNAIKSIQELRTLRTELNEIQSAVSLALATITTDLDLEKISNYLKNQSVERQTADDNHKGGGAKLTEKDIRALLGVLPLLAKLSA